MRRSHGQTCRITIVGFRAIRQGRYADHRRWMIRSFAMAMNTVLSRIYAPIAFIALAPHCPGEAVLSQWWLDRKPKPAIAR